MQRRHCIGCLVPPWRNPGIVMRCLGVHLFAAPRGVHPGGGRLLGKHPAKENKMAPVHPASENHHFGLFIAFFCLARMPSFSFFRYFFGGNFDFFRTIFNTASSAASQILLCRRMLGWNAGPLQLVHWQSGQTL
jgi:hypothetical protein